MRDLNFKKKLIYVKDDYNRTDDSIIIARDMDDYKYVYKQYAVISSEDIEDITEDNNYYEVILGKEEYCYKMYYDIDLYIDKDNIDEYDNKINDFIDLIAPYYKDLDEDFKKEDIITIEASRDIPDGKYKISKHIILPVYVDNPEELYTIFTHFNMKLRNFIDREVYDAIDKGVYVKNRNCSQLLRLLGQTKLGKPDSILKCKNPNIKLKDTLITQFNKDNKKLIDTTEMERLLKKMNEKEGRGYFNNKSYNMEADENANKDAEKPENGYDFKDMLNLNIPIQKENEYINNTDVVAFYKIKGFSTKTDCEYYLSVIPNTINHKFPFRLWWVIGNILKKFGVEYKIFENWTLNAYKTELNKVADECRKKWDNMKHTKYGLIHLINIAKAFNKEVYLKKVFAKKFINQYYYDKTKWVNVNMGADESMDIGKYYKEGKIGLITDENVGGGKTNAVINFTKEYIDEDHFTIVFSNRIYFATEISSRFGIGIGENEVLNYDKHREMNNFDLTDKKVLVISFESLNKRWKHIKKRIGKKTKLICCYDEMETLQRNLNGDTIVMLYETICNLTELWKMSAFNIVIDAYMTNRTYEYVNKQNELAGKKGEMVYINTDNRNKYPKTFNIRGIASKVKDRERMMECYTAEMGEILSENDYTKPDGIKRRICIFCEIYTSVQEIYSYLVNTLKIPKHLIAKHTGKDKLQMTPDELLKAKEFLEDKTKMSEIVVWIYTSSILNGVSVENIKFDKCYGIITRYSKSETEKGVVGIYGNDFLNAIARARQNNIWEVYIDLKESISFTYAKWRRDLTDDSIQADIKKIIVRETTLKKNNNMRCCRNNEEYDDDVMDEEQMKEINDITNLNSCFIDPENYFTNLQSGMFGVNNIVIYEKKKRDCGDGNIKTELVKYMEITELKYEEYKERDLLRGDIKANEITRLLKEGNSRLEEMNGVFKVEIVECLATIKNNKVNWVLDMEDKSREISSENANRFVNGLELIKTANKSKCLTNWDNRSIYGIDKIHTIVEKYYGLYGDDKENLCKMLNAEYRILEYIQVWIAIITRKTYKDFNPYYLLKILKKTFNIEKLDELPDVVFPENIENEDYYGKTKSIINEYKTGKKLKITPDPKTKTSSVFMKWLNAILKDTGYYYKEKKQRCKIVKYDLIRVKWDGIIVDCDITEYKEEQFEVIWDNKKLTFIEDDDY